MGLSKKVGPCYQCPERALECHSKCLRYAEYRAEIDAKTAKVKEKKNGERDSLWLLTVCRSKRIKKYVRER